MKTTQRQQLMSFPLVSLIIGSLILDLYFLLICLWPLDLLVSFLYFLAKVHTCHLRENSASLRNSLLCSGSKLVVKEKSSMTHAQVKTTQPYMWERKKRKSMIEKTNHWYISVCEVCRKAVYSSAQFSVLWGLQSANGHWFNVSDGARN